MEVDSQLIRTLARGGDLLFGRFDHLRFLWRFSGDALVCALSPSIYNPATLGVTIRQIYFTCYRVLAVFVLFAALLSYVISEIVITAAQAHGLSQYALELILRVLSLEVLPFFAALYVALRSGAAINTEVALMNILHEVEALERSGVDPMRYEFVPRIAACAVSVLSLTVISGVVSIVLAYPAVYGLQLGGLPEFTRIVGNVFSLPIAIGFLLKSLLFGVAVAVIPIASGLAVRRKLLYAPIAVLQGMVRLFFTLGLIEVASLAVKYI